MSQAPEPSPLGSAEKSRPAGSISAEKTEPKTDTNYPSTDPTPKSLEAATPAKEEGSDRPVWDNQAQFILSTIGLAVGLGNIWKFPGLAYENGGSAFLFPYITCAVIFALPLVYCEFVIGQYASASPAMAIRKYAPAFQGLGWAMALLAGSVAIYYTVVIAWAGVYMQSIIMGEREYWTSCENDWNTLNCTTSLVKNEKCTDPDASFLFRNNDTCGVNNASRSAVEEYFMLNIIKKSNNIEELGGFHMRTFGWVLGTWIVVYLILIKGVKYLGYASYVTSTLPYVIIAIFFAKGITLDGAEDGIYYYLGKPDWSMILKMETWLNAVKQLLFSISIGYGGLISLASYSKFQNNCFRDALIVIVGDTFMSVFGGVAVFSILGFMAKTMKKDITHVISNGKGLSLVFVVYPEAIAHMGSPTLWAVLFFLMLLCLGLGTEVALVEVLCSCIYDQFPKTRKMKWVISLCVCVTYFALGSIMSTGCGWYWFNLYNDFTGSTSACFIAALEAILIGIVYGVKNHRLDQLAMFGQPRNAASKYIGPASPYWGWTLATVCPVIAVIIGIATIVTPIRSGALKELEPGYDGEKHVIYTYPMWAMVIGWILNLIPIAAVPVVFAVNWFHNMRAGNDFMELFRVQKKHRSYGRINGIVDKKNKSVTAEKVSPVDENANQQKSGSKEKPASKEKTASKEAADAKEASSKGEE